MVLPLFARKALCILLALVCAFSFLTVPVRAVALSTGVIVGISAVLAVGAALMGLGIGPIADSSSAFDNLCSTIVSSLPEPIKYIGSAGQVMVKSLVLGENYFFQEDFLSEVLSLVLATGAVTSKPGVKDDLFDFPSGYSRVSYALADFQSWGLIKRYGLVHCTVGTLTTGQVAVIASASMPSIVSASEGYALSFPEYVAWYLFADNGTMQRSYAKVDSWSKKYYFTNHSTFAISPIYSSSTLTVGAFSGSLQDEEYKTWVQDPVISINFGVELEPSPEDPTDPQIPIRTPWHPIRIPSNPTEVPNYTQIEIQQGGPSQVDPEYIEKTDTKIELDEETVPEDLRGSDDNGGNNDTGNNSGSGSGGSITNSTDVKPDRFKLDLKTLFPFCIPFDLYAMLNALNAEPETPVFTLGIPFAGQIYRFTVDLSAWNSIAAILRTCQVALFCVGLTQATRKYIKW